MEKEWQPIETASERLEKIEKQLPLIRWGAACGFAVWVTLIAAAIFLL